MLLKLKIIVVKAIHRSLLVAVATLMFAFNAFGQNYQADNNNQLDKLRVSTPRFALKTNLLYAGATLTPNLGFEFGIGPKSTIELSGSYSWLGRTAPASDQHKQLVHMIARPEYRWWFCERYNGHFLGANLMYTRYNVSGIFIPYLFEEGNRYDGYAAGAGIEYGYNWAFAKRWNLEFNIGFGYSYMDYDRFTCVKCDRSGESLTRHYVGPTSIGISLMFLFK